MQIANGKAFFFAQIGEELARFVGKPVPDQVAVKASDTVPLEDIKDVAIAVAQSLTNSGSSLVVGCGAVGISAPVTALIIDCEERALAEGLYVFEANREAVSCCVCFNFIEDGSAVTRIDYNPDNDFDVIGSALKELFRACNKKYDPISLVRFRHDGFKCLERNFDLFEDQKDEFWTDDLILDRFLHRLARTWRYQDQAVSSAHLKRWVDQFKKAGLLSEAIKILIHLMRVGFVTEQRIAAGLLQRYKIISGGEARSVTISIQPAGKSEQKIAYNLRPEIELIPFSDALDQIEANGPGASETTLFVFDDCVGSGETIIAHLLEAPDSGRLEQALFLGKASVVIITYHGHVAGIGRIETHHAAHTRVRVEVVNPLDKTQRVFSSFSKILPESESREKMKDYCAGVGGRLFPDDPLGWDNCQWCVVYDYSVPDLSLPVIWAQDENWTALFLRKR